MTIQKIQEISLRIFFPMMYICVAVSLTALWLEEYLGEPFYKLIPTFLIIGLASGITWAISIIIELRNIAKAKK